MIHPAGIEPAAFASGINSGINGVINEVRVHQSIKNDDN